VSWCPGGDRLDQDIFDAMTEFITQLMQRGEQLAERFNVPVSCMKAIRRVGDGVAMKALGQQLHCDPSFVTMIADALEQRGLARREPNPSDRRIKNLVLTPRGREVKATLEQETLGQMPWTQALSVDEREQFLTFVRKMNQALSASPPSAGGSPTSAATVEEVASSTNSARPVIS
jgi:DNA-binding MarR family transcriptional regulator